jgi:hypothetical protein
MTLALKRLTCRRLDDEPKQVINRVDESTLDDPAACKTPLLRDRVYARYSFFYQAGKAESSQSGGLLVQRDQIMGNRLPPVTIAPPARPHHRREPPNAAC